MKFSFAVLFLFSACGSSSSSMIDAASGDARPPDAAPPSDGPHIDAPPPGNTISISKWPRQGATFVPVGNGGQLPFVHGFQGFNYVELQVRVPASVTASMPTFALHYDVTGLGGMDQNNALALMPASGGTRDSDRYLIFFNQFTIAQLDGVNCHITAQLPQSPQVGAIDETVTLRYTGCLDTGPDVVCPDGGVP